MGMDSEAVKTYRHVLQRNPQTPGAHYGLAFLLLRQGARTEAIEHLEAFLAAGPPEDEAGEHITHAKATLGDLRGETGKDGSQR